MAVDGPAVDDLELAVQVDVHREGQRAAGVVALAVGAQPLALALGIEEASDVRDVNGLRSNICRLDSSSIFSR